MPSPTAFVEIEEEVTEPNNETRHVVLLLDDDPIVTEGLAIGMEQPGRTIVTCNDLESAQLAVEWIKPTHIVADVRLSGPFGFEGLDFIRYAKQHSPESRIIIMTGDATDALKIEALQRGAAAFLQKPFGGRRLEAVINMMGARSSNVTPPLLIRIPLLGEIIEDHLYSVFQPIVTLGDSPQTFGYEALARCQNLSFFQNPTHLFEYAGRKHRICDLELACITRSIASAAPLLTNDEILFLNIHPLVFAEGTRLFDLLRIVDPTILPKLVLEITEQGALVDTPAVFDQIEKIRALGVRFAFDDFGVAYSHLPFIDRVRPSFLKISQNFGTRFETNSTMVKIITNIVSIGRDFDCDLVLEGIEDASTALAAKDLGIRHGQGYLFGRPAGAPTLSNA